MLTSLGSAGVLEPGDLFDLKFLRAARLSPDGRHAVFTVSHTDDSTERFETWIADLESSKRTRLPYAGDAHTPCWSADGRRIAIVADGRLRVVEFSSLTLSEPLTPAEFSIQGTPSWSPNGVRLALSLQRRNPAKNPRRIDTTIFHADGIGYLGDIEQYIHELDLANGGLRLLAAPKRFCSQPQWSPCGRYVLFFAGDDPIPFASFSQRLLTVAVDGGAITEVLGERWFVEAARWIPESCRIAVAASLDSTLTVPTSQLWTMDMRGGDVELRTRDRAGTVGFRMNHDMPARELTGTSPFCVLDRQTAFMTIQSGGTAQIWCVSLEGELSLHRVSSGGERSCLALDANRAGDALLFAVTSLYSPTELMRASLDGTNESRLTALNDDVLARWPRPRVEHFEFSSAHETKIEAWFMGQAARQGPGPCILFVHAGPFVATGHAFRYDFHHLVSHGYGIVFANFRGSAGYSEEFMRAIMGDWGGYGFPDHMGAIDAAIGRGYADPNRLGVWGPSHGGFATCWIVGHTDRFKAAVAEASTSNLVTSYYNGDAPEVRARDIGGRPHEIPELYRTRSPLTYAHRCTTPTLLLHGEADLRCPIGEAEQFFRALRDAGCTTELVRIPDCSHLGDSNGPLSARRAQNEALVDWFHRYL